MTRNLGIIMLTTLLMHLIARKEKKTAEKTGLLTCRKDWFFDMQKRLALCPLEKTGSFMCRKDCFFVLQKRLVLCYAEKTGSLLCRKDWFFDM